MNVGVPIVALQFQPEILLHTIYHFSSDVKGRNKIVAFHLVNSLGQTYSYSRLSYTRDQIHARHHQARV